MFASAIGDTFSGIVWILGLPIALQLRFSAPDRQIAEAVRCWKAGEVAAALHWARLASRRSDLAKVVLAQWLVHADHDERARVEAVALMTDAAQRGCLEAQQVLGAWYLDGSVVERSPVQAGRWLQSAADAGSVQCQLAMVRLLTSGEFREPDLELARHYAQRAAAAGHPEMLQALEREE